MNFCCDNSTGQCSCRKFGCDPVKEGCKRYAEALAERKGETMNYDTMDNPYYSKYCGLYVCIAEEYTKAFGERAWQDLGVQIEDTHTMLKTAIKQLANGGCNGAGI